VLILGKHVSGYSLGGNIDGEGQTTLETKTDVSIIRVYSPSLSSQKINEIEQILREGQKKGWHYCAWQQVKGVKSKVW